MTSFVLFEHLSLLGELRAGEPTGTDQPLVDPSGRPVPEDDDGAQSKPLPMATMSAGLLQSPDDPGTPVFGSAGLETVLTWTDSRLIVLAHSPTTGQWAGQVRYRWVSDVVVRPPAGRRDAGAVRVLFLDPLAGADFQGRQYVDLSPTRKTDPAELAWDLVQRIAVDRHRWIPSGAVADHTLIDQVLRHGPQPPSEQAAYSIPMPVLTQNARPAEIASSTESTVTIVTAATAVPAPLAVTDVEARVVAAEWVSQWSPPTDPADQDPAAFEWPAVDDGSAGGLISAVPGMARQPAGAAGLPPMVQAAPGPSTAWPPTAAGSGVPAGSYRVEMDSGDVVVIDSPTLFGRDPAAHTGESAQLHAVPDASFSYSKTHLMLSPSAGGISVTDRHSTNGVLIEHGGRLAPCPPGIPQLLELPATLRLGTRWMKVGI